MCGLAVNGHLHALNNCNQCLSVNEVAKKCTLEITDKVGSANTLSPL